MKFGINCGHTKSGAGSGAIGVLNESIEARNIGYVLMNLLRSAGHEVIDCTIDNAPTRSAYLEQVVQLANRQDLDYFISVHLNKTVGAKGTEVYTYKGRQFPDALEVCANISALGFVNRGVKEGTGLYVIKKTKAKSMLIEVCFLDEPDAIRYKELGANKFAEAICSALIGTVPTVSNPQPQPNPKPAGHKYSVGQKVRFSTCYASSTDPVSKAIPSSRMARDNGTITKIKDGVQNPYLLDNGLCWVNDGDIREVLNGSAAPSVSYYPAANSNSIVDGLKAIGVDSSYSHRKQIASANGIANYSGTAGQNEQLCTLLKQGKLIKA